MEMEAILLASMKGGMNEGRGLIGYHVVNCLQSDRLIYFPKRISALSYSSNASRKESSDMAAGNSRWSGHKDRKILETGRLGGMYLCVPLISIL